MRLAGVAICFLLLGVATSSPAQASVRWGACGKAERIPGKGVKCSNGFTYPFAASAAGQEWVVKLTTPVTQCAPVRFSVELDGVRLGTTAVLESGRTETMKLGKAIAAGPHSVTVKVQVNFGGCYPEEPAVQPQSWGLDARVILGPS